MKALGTRRYSVTFLRCYILYRRLTSRRSMRRICIRVMQYYPIATTAIGTIYCILLLIGIENDSIDNVLDVDVTKGMLIVMKHLCVIVFFLISSAYGFCKLNKLMICYTFLLILCIDIRRYVGFGHHITSLRYFMAASGILLLSLLIIQQRNNLTSLCHE